jgi:hypothetical protein
MLGTSSACYEQARQTISRARSRACCTTSALARSRGEALDYLDALFGAPDAPGLDLVAEAVTGLEAPAFIRASTRALAEALTRSLQT